MRISSGFFVLLVEFAALFDTSSFSAECAEIVKLRLANLTFADNFYSVDAGAVDGEDSFHTYAV